jgi:hypothetical protein
MDSTPGELRLTRLEQLYYEEADAFGGAMQELAEWKRGAQGRRPAFNELEKRGTERPRVALIAICAIRGVTAPPQDAQVAYVDGCAVFRW